MEHNLTEHNLTEHNLTEHNTREHNATEHKVAGPEITGQEMAGPAGSNTGLPVPSPSRQIMELERLRHSGPAQAPVMTRS